MSPRRLVVFLGAMAALLLSYSPTGAQTTLPKLKIGQPQSQSLINVFVPVPRELKQRLTRAEKALEEDRVTDAIDEIAALINSVGERDYFVGDFKTAGTSASLSAELERLVARLPATARRTYEQRFGTQAGALLQEAINDGDLLKLEEVSRKFVYTEAGNHALLLLGRHHLDHRRPLQAAMHLERLAAAPQSARDFDPELSVLLAVCWQLAGLEPRAEGIIKRLKRDFPAAVAKVDLRQSQVANQSDTPGSQITLDGSMKLVKRWEGWLLDATVKEFLEDIERQFLSSPSGALPALQTTEAGPFVVARTPTKIAGFDLASGKLVWHFPVLLGREPPNPNVPAQIRSQTIHQRAWEDGLWGSVAADENSVYLINNLEYFGGGRANRAMVIIGGRPQIQTQSAQTTNQLVALDLQREGAFRWMAGDASGGSDPKLAGAFFLGPPLAMMQELYILAELNSEIQLLALGADDGRLQWSQSLATIGQRNITTNKQRRLTAVSPVYSSGMLICPTAAGAVVGINLATRSLKWGFQYEQQSGNAQINARMMMLARANPKQTSVVPSDDWRDARVLVSGDRVVFASPETEQLFGLDLLTGKKIWERPRQDLLFVGAVRDGVALMVAKHRFTGLRLEDGNPAWKETPYVAIPTGGSPSGRGSLLGAHYLLPTTDKELLVIAMDDGQIVSRQPLESVLGNVICHQNHLLSLKPTGLARFDFVSLEQLKALGQDAIPAKDP